MKKVSTAQKMLKLMGLIRNLFAVNVGRYAKPASLRKHQLKQTVTRWNEVALQVIYA